MCELVTPARRGRTFSTSSLWQTQNAIASTPIQQHMPERIPKQDVTVDILFQQSRQRHASPLKPAAPSHHPTSQSPPLNRTPNLSIPARAPRQILHILRLDLDDGAMIRLAGPDEIIHGAEQRNSARDENRPVHVIGGDVGIARPEAEEEDEEEVDAREGVVRDAQRAADAPRAPGCADHAVGRRGRVGGVRGAADDDAACAAAVEEEAGC
jgi:hypothetical protein